MLEIAGLPAVHRDRRILAHRVGRHAVFERGQIDERLERGAGLALGRDGAVELALGVVLAADQRAHGAVRRHGDERAFADAELCAALRQRLDERLLGRILQVRIDRGVDDDVGPDVADEIVDRIHHPVGDVVGRAGADLGFRLRRMGDRLPRGVGADHGLLAHVGDDEFRPALGAVGIARRREPRRRFHQARQHGGFGERQLPRRFAEIALRGGFHPVGAGAEIDAIEIEFEDLLLGEFVLEPEGQQHFLQLAR